MDSLTDSPEPAFLTAPAPESEAPRPIPWEDPETYPEFWSRVIQTFKQAFNNPMGFFERIPLRQGLGRPWGFLLLCHVPNYLLFLLILLLAGMFLAMLGLAAAKDNLFRNNPALAWILPIAMVGFVVLLPFLQFLTMLVLGGLQHFFLWLFGGTKAGLGAEQTIRACTYAWAGIGLITFLPSLIPYLGVLIVLPLQLGGMVFTGMGLARLHRTDTWRGIAAVFGPVVLGCCCLIALWMTLFASVVLPNALKFPR